MKLVVLDGHVELRTAQRQPALERALVDDQPIDVALGGLSMVGRVVEARLDSGFTSYRVELMNQGEGHVAIGGKPAQVAEVPRLEAAGPVEWPRDGYKR